jgi:hypothetical protein
LSEFERSFRIFRRGKRKIEWKKKKRGRECDNRKKQLEKMREREEGKNIQQK